MITNGNLPVEGTSFVGRRRELSEVRDLFSGSRLVTLVGVGGVGKTRLAIRAARDMQRLVRDGIWLIELALLSDSSLVTQATADSLGLPQSARGPLTELSEYLATRQALLVIDNCEHLLDSCASLVTTLLQRCTKLRILTTSRQILNVAGEQVFTVPPLSVPQSDDHIPSVDGMIQYEALSLLLERAASAAPGFSATPANCSTITRLCQRLDGLPLAIELAVVRLRALSIEQILELVDDRFRLLNTGRRGSIARQETLHKLIEWSWDLCTHDEQQLWAKMSAFARGFDLPAVEQVCSGDNIQVNTVLDLVGGLIDKSILSATASSTGMRYHMLETIQQFGHRRLALTPGTEALKIRHRFYYRNLIAEAEQQWFSTRQVDWADRLYLEHPNLRAALEACLTGSPDDQLGLEFASALWPYWVACGYLGEGRHWLTRMLAAGRSPTRARAKALWSCGSLAVLQGDIPAGVDQLRECIQLATDLADPTALAWAKQYLGLASMFIGADLSPAISLLQEAVNGHRDSGNVMGLAKSLYMLSSVLSFTPDLERCVASANECVEIADDHDEQWCKSYGLYMLSLAAWRQDNPESAERLALSSVSLRRPFRDYLGLAMSIDMVAWTAGALGKPQRAARLLGSVERLWRSVGALEFGFAEMVGYNDQCQKRVRADLGDKQFQIEYQIGQHFDDNQVIGYALGDKVASGQTDHATDAKSRITARENQIAGLVAQGLTNRQIAETLVISQRTVESHIDHILTKLAFTSRAQIAAWAADQAAARPV